MSYSPFPNPIDANVLTLPAGAASEPTLAAILAALTADVPELPPQPLLATNALTPVYIRRTTAGTSEIAAAVVDQTTRLHRYRFTCSGPVTFQIKDGAGNLIEEHEMFSAGGYEGEFWEQPYAETDANEALNMVTNAAVTVNAKFWVVTSAT